MRDSIKQLLKEQQEKYDTLEMLRTYQGNNKVLNDLALELKVLGRLSQTKINKAISQFKKEFYTPTILDSLNNNDKLKSEIKSLGIKTYNDIVRTDKKLLLSSTKKIKVGKPNMGWVLRNIKDLNTFKNNIPDTNKKFSFPDRDEELTIHEECEELLKQLVKKDFWGFIEGKEWSILNRINTNYTNWNKLIAKRDAENELKGVTVKDKVYDYFEQKPFERVYDFSGMDEEMKNKVIQKIPTLSLADVDVITMIIASDDLESNYDFNKLISRIKRTTEQGEKAEEKFIQSLIDNGIPKNDIKIFSSYGNLVDITFQCDLMVKLKGVFRPIQVKSRETKFSKLLSYDIGGMIVYPAPTKYNCGDWVFYDGKSLADSFDEKFLDLNCSPNQNK